MTTQRVPNIPEKHMNAQQEKQTQELDEKWTLLKELVDQTANAARAVNRMTDAIIYLADVIGGKGDAAKMTVNAPVPAELAGSELDPAPAPAKEEAKPAKEETEEVSGKPGKSEPSLEDVRAAMNAYARANGKAKAMELIDRYSPTRKVEDIDPAKYAELLMEAA